MIPFCSFGAELDIGGQDAGQFQVPVCSIFREKMVGGDICYQADLKQVKKLHWKKTLQRGLSLIIDTNDEYDVKNLMERKSREKEVSNDFGFDTYKQAEEEDSFYMMLQTISKDQYNDI